MIQIAASPLAVPTGPTRPVLLAAQSGTSNFALALGSLLVPGAGPKAVVGETPIADAPLPGRQIAAEPGKELPEIALDLAGDEDAPEQKSQADDDTPQGDELTLAWFAAPAAPVADAAPVAPVVARTAVAATPTCEISRPESAPPERKDVVPPAVIGEAAPPVVGGSAPPLGDETKPRATQRVNRQTPTALPEITSLDTVPAAETAPTAVDVPGSRPARAARKMAAATPVAEPKAATTATVTPDAREVTPTPATPIAGAQPVRPHRNAKYTVPVVPPAAAPIIPASAPPAATMPPYAQPAVAIAHALPMETPAAETAPVVAAQLAPPPGSALVADFGKPVQATSAPVPQPGLAAALPTVLLAPAAQPVVAADAASGVLATVVQPVLPPAIAPAQPPAAAPQPAPASSAPAQAPPVPAQFLRQPIADAAPVVRVEAPAVRSDTPVGRTDAGSVQLPPARQPGLDAAQPATVASLIAHLPAQTIAAQPFAFNPMRRALQESDQPLVTTIAAPGLATLQQIAAAPDAQQGTLDMRRQEWTGKMVEMIEAMREAAPVKETRISLMPEALGKVDISVRQDGDRIHVHFAAETQAARQILTDAQPRLAELAEARGIRLGQTSVDSGQAGPNAQSGQRNNESQRPQTPSAPASARTAKDQLSQTDDRVA